jgi:hypothetical protein
MMAPLEVDAEILGQTERERRETVLDAILVGRAHRESPLPLVEKHRSECA